jgi:hypothetical protein
VARLGNDLHERVEDGANGARSAIRIVNVFFWTITFEI